jgi:hypothetical protein
MLNLGKILIKKNILSFYRLRKRFRVENFIVLHSFFDKNYDT